MTISSRMNFYIFSLSVILYTGPPLVTGQTVPQWQSFSSLSSSPSSSSSALPQSSSSLATTSSANTTRTDESGQEERRSYKGYSVLRLTPTSSDQLDFLRSLELKDPELDFWTQPSGLNKSVDVMVSPKTTLKLEKSLRRLNIDKQLMIEDVERIVSKERQALEEGTSDADSLTFRTSGNSFFTLYHREDRIYEFLDNLIYNYPDHVSVSSIGKSYEGRDIKVIKVSASKSQDQQTGKKPAVYLDGGLHAREWISVSTALFVAEKLASGYASDAAIKRLLDHYDFCIIPLANPDGYEYTHTRDRLWRKTRSRHLPYGISIFGCRGVDPNRNFDFHWNEVGASDNPCTDVYAGPRAFSEPETRAIADFILANKEQIKIFIALHSYSQLWLTPWGYTATLPTSYYELEARALAATQALSRKYNTVYQVGSATNILYAAAGGADDWAHGVAKIPYVYTVELRDTGRYGFMLPKDQILPTAEEFFDGLKHLASDLIPNI